MAKLFNRSTAMWSDHIDREPVTADVAVRLEDIETFRASSFPQGVGPRPWLDGPGARRAVRRLKRRGSITPHEAALCKKWADDGYIVTERLFDEDLLDWAWDGYERAIADGTVTPPREPQFDGDAVPGRVLNPHFQVPEIKELMYHPKLRHVIELLLGAACIPFQSISGHKASQQAIHSDSIHMTTYPEHYLVAMWVAFGDISPDSGPLVYYPGSHRLPTIYSDTVGIPAPADHVPNYGDFDRLYTPALENAAKESGLEPSYFTARKGDVLFWHANLIHGGSSRRNFDVTRKALVFHFFAEGCLCYHDLSGGRAWIHTEHPERPDRDVATRASSSPS